MKILILFFTLFLFACQSMACGVYSGPSVPRYRGSYMDYDGSQSSWDTREPTRSLGIGSQSSWGASSLEIISRSSWGARPPKTIKTLPTPVPIVVVHHTAYDACDGLNSCKRVLKSIQNYHMDDKYHLWDDIGYNFLVDNDGQIYEGVGWTTEGAHVYGYNHRSIGISFNGNYDNMVPTYRQKQALVNFLRYGVKQGYIAKNYELYGHRDLNNKKSCPGDNLYDIVKTLPHKKPSKFH